jgi:hypothetical protein
VRHALFRVSDNPAVHKDKLDIRRPRPDTGRLDAPN